MKKSELNGERWRSNARKRWNWAKVLIRPLTLKMLVTWGKGAVEIIRLALEVIDLFRK
jgi:hypothetical protein